jgi:regulator of nucleoside diphosphate kinase
VQPAGGKARPAGPASLSPAIHLPLHAHASIAGPLAKRRNAPFRVTLPNEECFMEFAIRGERTLTDLDHVRLARLLHARGCAESSSLGDALDTAQLVPSRKVARHVVTMGSQVLLTDLDMRRTWTLTVCYPDEANVGEGFVSVLSPVGASLIGLRVGDTAHWRTPRGDPGAATVLAVTFQPEASGLYTL